MIDPAPLPLAFDLRRSNGDAKAWMTCSCGNIREVEAVHEEGGAVELQCRSCGVCVQLRSFLRRLPDGGRPGSAVKRGWSND